MESHEEMIRFHAQEHVLIDTDRYDTKEEYVLKQMHVCAYLRASALSQNKTILDLGCNTGYGSSILCDSAQKVVAVDISENAISSARKLHEDKGITFQVIDGRTLPFNDNTFDLIISCQVIEHIVDYDLYLNEIKRVLSPEGSVIFTTPNALLRLDPGMKPWNPFHVHEFNHSDLKVLLRQHFSSVSVLGLTAKDPLYSIELNRVTRARENARKRNRTKSPWNPVKLLRAAIKWMIPRAILQRLQKSKIPPPQDQSISPADQIDSNFIKEYGPRDFFYQSDDLDKALDLLAICSNDDTTTSYNRDFLLQIRQ